MRAHAKRSALGAGGPRLLMVGAVATFVIATVGLIAAGANPVVLSLVGAAVLISCGLACLWAWRLSARQARAFQDAVRTLAESRGAARRQPEDSR